ncbi:hypothetical protein AAF712_008576 [Marasmius tenuissimus]|uniref:Uncharacterized protein n=1 Tax=Marasmius tenuissimus TaxID=585030 RepID=A0ABR2ZUR6_9AGAR
MQRELSASRMTSQRDDSASNFGSESRAPSRNIFHNAEEAGLANEEALLGEFQEGETTEIVKESSPCRRWVALCWILTWWLPNPCLTYIGRMKRLDARQAWREKLALNMVVWFTCGCSIFVIAALGLLICPTQHAARMRSTRGLCRSLSQRSWLTGVNRKSADDVFPMQIRAVCGGVNGNLSPFVSFNPKNNLNPSALYHNFRSYTRCCFTFSLRTSGLYNTF